MKKKLIWTFEATLDEKHRFILPSSLYKNVENDELFSVLAKSAQWENYIKIIIWNAFEKNINPLECDSLELAKKYPYSKIQISQEHRILLNKKETEWIFGAEPKNIKWVKLTCIWLWDHVAITKKTIEDVLDL